MRLSVIALFLSLFTPVLNTLAQSDTIPAPEERDWVAWIDEGTCNAEMKMRSVEAVAILDQRMEALIAELALELDAEAVALLRESQSNWQAYAYSTSAFLADAYRGGTHQGLAHGLALIAEQKRRIDELQAMARARLLP